MENENKNLWSKICTWVGIAGVIMAAIYLLMLAVASGTIGYIILFVILCFIIKSL